MYVNHYQDLSRAKRDPKFVYDIGNNQEYTGLSPPSNAKPKGILYPRAGVLGGCVSHNALVWILPHRSDWDNIANITGDASWEASAMEQYMQKVYEWLHVQPTDPTIILKDLALAQQLCTGAAVQGVGLDLLDAMGGLGHLLAADPNDYRNPARDSAQGFYQIPLIMKDGARRSVSVCSYCLSVLAFVADKAFQVRERILDTIAAGHPLTLKTDTFVTRVIIDQSGCSPKATGVEFLEGEYLYKASPLSGGRGKPGTVRAKKEVILSGGAFNTVQMLKLSGIGPREELDRFNISVIQDLPGVGQNLQDRYEVPVNVKHEEDFPLLDGCTFDGKDHDECYKQWVDNPYLLTQKGPYATNGLAAAMVVRSDYASTPDSDLFIFGGPINFVGYYPQWGDHAVADHKHFSWYALKAHTRNKAGTVQLRSSDPLDPPVVNFNYFDEGTTADGADVDDLKAMAQAVNISRKALSRYHEFDLLGGSDFVEEAPGPDVASEEDIEQYVRDNAWGHHASCTNPIGADDDKLAVLDSKFRVRGVGGLRVVDASVFPKIPGVFIQAPIYIVSEKAADVVIQAWSQKAYEAQR